MTHGTDGTLPPAEADLLCQVCGAPLEGRILWCRHCDTPHHADCWEFNGGCSTFGCGSKRARSTQPRLPTAADPEPLVLTMGEDEVGDEGEYDDDDGHDGPVLVIDDGLPGPAPALRATASWALQLPVGAARQALRALELLCWPGWAAASLAFDKAGVTPPPMPAVASAALMRWVSRATVTFDGDDSLPGRFSEWLFGTRTLNVVRAVLLMGVLYAVHLQAVAKLGVALLVPLGATMLLAPPLRRSLAELADLLPPPPEEPEHLPVIARDAVLFALHLPRRVARQALRALECLCWPGWVIGTIAYDMTDDKGRPTADASPVSRFVAWMFGAEVLHVLRTLIILAVVWAFACIVLRDERTPVAGLVPLGAYMLLAPPLKLLFERLGGLLLPGPEEPGLVTAERALPALPSRRRKGRRSRKRRHRH